LLIEESGSIPLTNGSRSGSRRPKTNTDPDSDPDPDPMDPLLLICLLDPDQCFLITCKWFLDDFVGLLRNFYKYPTGLPLEKEDLDSHETLKAKFFVIISIMPTLPVVAL
jgi:hypothetical protein